jgi:hypothetical protein
MFGILAIIGLGVILWWLSKGLKRLSAWLENASVTIADLAVCSKKNINSRTVRQNIIAEKQLQNIKGDVSDVTHTHKVRQEIDELEKFINSPLQT